MNKDVLLLRELIYSSTCTQRELAKKLSISLGTTNALLRHVIEEGKLCKKNDGYHLTPEGLTYLENFRVNKAVIFAAGFGSRFVPLTFEMPKGLLEVNGERMIERQIKQLHAVSITDITIVVGYLKEKFDYLIDAYGVKLLYNPEYATKNTIGTFYHARHLFLDSNTYLLSSDNWIRENIYHTYEPYAWYSASYMEGNTKEWCLLTNKQQMIIDVTIGGHDSYAMYGPAYLTREFSKVFLPLIIENYHKEGHADDYWEHSLRTYINKKMYLKTNQSMYIQPQPADTIYEFENLEELRLFDTSYNESSGNIAMELIADVFDITENEITDIRCLKAGMTNKSFLFRVKDKQYICRIPGTGTDILINRKNEYASFLSVADLHITERIIYFNPKTGYKISRYYENSRTADSRSSKDMKSCMQLLNTLHTSHICVPHAFDIQERITYYEKLCVDGGDIPFEDYVSVRKQMDALLAILSTLPSKKVLCHIDSVADNFLILSDGTLKLIDWEYAGMADAILDISMCAIYSYYTKEEADALLEMYLGRPPKKEETIKLYAYMALGGFLWTLWTVYKLHKGEEFGEYSLKMYRYAKDFYKSVIKM